jgi:recombination protein RecR
MDIKSYPSRYLERAVTEFSKLPGIGHKTAFRLVLHLLKQETSSIKNFTSAIDDLSLNIQLCQQCHNLSDSPVCEICSNSSRDAGLICVVESFKEVMAIENTTRYKGLYHVLGGVISPMEGIGPSELNIPSLESRIEQDNIREVIMALSTTMEGETTGLYLFRKLQRFNIIVSTLAKGVSVGDHLEYTDELTLGQSIINRIQFKG